VRDDRIVSEQPIGERLVLANDRIRVWEDVVAPGDQQPVHTHRSPYLSVMLTAADAEVVDDTGQVVYRVQRGVGDATWFGADRIPTTHTLRNTGSDDVRVLVVEVLGS